MAEKSKKQIYLLELIREKPRTFEELQDEISKWEKGVSAEKTAGKTGLSLRTFKGIMSDLNKSLKGEKVKGIRGDNGKLYYSVVHAENKNPEKSGRIYEKLKDRTVRKALVLFVMLEENRPMTLTDIANEFKRLFNEDVTGSTYDLDSVKRDLRKSIISTNDGSESLVEAGYLREINVNNEVCYELTEKTPVSLVLEANTFEFVKNKLEVLGGIYHQEEMLKDIEVRLSKLQNLREEPLNTYRLVCRSIGRNADISNYSDKIKMLVDAEYWGKTLLVEYEEGYKRKAKEEKTPDGQSSVIRFEFKVGMVLYADDKDKLYLVGEKRKSKIILDINRIKSVKALNKVNDIFESDEYDDLFHEMFSVSSEAPIDVEIEFSDTGNVFHKLDLFVRLNRGKYASLERISKFVDGEKADKIIYKDRVRGIGDFMKFIRSYGNAVVKRPEILKRQIIDGIDRTLEKYAAEGYCDE